MIDLDSDQLDIEHLNDADIYDPRSTPAHFEVDEGHLKLVLAPDPTASLSYQGPVVKQQVCPKLDIEDAILAFHVKNTQGVKDWNILLERISDFIHILDDPDLKRQIIQHHI